jgi:hypothetical protein
LTRAKTVCRRDSSPPSTTWSIIYDTLFINAITINIHVGYGEIDGESLGSNALGESYAPQYLPQSYGSVRNALQVQGTPGASTLPSSSPLSGSL